MVLYLITDQLHFFRGSIPFCSVFCTVPLITLSGLLQGEMRLSRLA